MWFELGMTAMFASQIADGATTVEALKKKLTDLNPVVNYLWAKLGTAGVIGLKAAYLALVVLLWVLYAGHGPQYVGADWYGQVLLVLSSVGFGSAAVNLFQMKKL